MTAQAPAPAPEPAGGLPDTIRIGRCDTGQPCCGQPARWTVAGWRCPDHRPRAHHHD